MQRPLVVAAVALLAHSPLAQRVPDTRINTVSGAPFVSAPHVVAVGDTVHAVWIDARNGMADVYYSRSSDAGESWLADDVRLDTDAPGSALSQAARLALSGDAVYVAWRDARSGNRDVYFNRSLDGGSTWLASDVRIDSDPPGLAFSGEPTIAAEGGRVYIAWEDNRDGEHDIFFDRSLDGGLTWQAQDARLDPGTPAGAFRSLNVRLAASADAVYVVWEDWQTTALGDIFFNRSLDGGATWLAREARVEQNQPPQRKSIAAEVAAAGDAVYCVWSDFRNAAPPDIYFNRSLDGGSTWLAQDVRLDTGDPPGASTSQRPRLDARDERVCVVWEDSRQGGSAIHANRSLDQGSTWLASDVRLSDPLVSARSPLVGVHADYVLAVWEQADPVTGVLDIFADRSLDGGATWLAADVRLDTGDPPGAAKSDEPSLAVSDDTALVLWRDARNGVGSDVFFNIPFGALPYGQGTAGSGAWVPTLSTRGAPLLGASLEVAVERGLGGAAAWLVLGTGGRANLPLLGATLLAQPPLRTFALALGGEPGKAGAGRGTRTFTLPQDPSVSGTSANLQAAVVDPGAAGGVVATTRGVELWLQ